jgi:uncharacterized protein YqjF (DUF2071 family)
VFPAAPNSLEDFLTARYRLFAVGRRGVRVTEIDHEPWSLQRAEAEIEINTIGEAAGIPLTDPPAHLLFSRVLDVRIWPPRRA